MYLVFFLCMNLIINLFSASPKDDVDRYIERLKKILPMCSSDCFVNVCDEAAKRGVEELQLDFSRYFFVNRHYIAECFRESLAKEMGFSPRATVFANLAASLGDWMECCLYKFDRCEINSSSGVQDYRKRADLESMHLYDRDVFLSACLQDAVAARRQENRSASVLRGRKGEGVTIAEPLNKAQSVAKTIKSRSVSSSSKKALRINPVTIQGESEKIEPVSAIPEQIISMPELIAVPISTCAFAEERVEEKVDPDNAMLRVSAFNATEIARGLTSKQLVALDERYAGRGMNFEEKYRQAILDGLFEELARNPTPIKRSVSRSPARERRSISQSPAKIRPSFDVMLEEEERNLTPSRIRPLAVFYESESVKNIYSEFFSRFENSAANTHFQTFLRDVQQTGLKNYIGKMEKFHSMLGVRKIRVGDKARILFKHTKEQGGIILLGDPNHYGDL